MQDKDLPVFEFPSEISGFSQAEYLIIFLSLIFAFVIAEFFISSGKILKHRQRIVFYWEFLAWMVLLLTDFILTWYMNWPRLVYIYRNLWSFILLLIPPFIYFLIVAVYFPGFDTEGNIDLKKHFLNNIRLFFLLFSLYLIICICLEVLLPTSTTKYSVYLLLVFLILTLLNSFISRVWLRVVLIIIYFIQVILTIPFM